MVKLPFRRWRKAPPMFVFMLAVMLPAAALVVSSVVYLRHIQRSKMIDAAIQVDYQQILAIAEKRIVDRTFEIAEDAHATFPDVNDSDALDDFLRAHPDVVHAFIWAGKGNMTFRSQPDRMSDPDFRAENKKVGADFETWFDLESQEHIATVKSFEAAERAACLHLRRAHSPG